MNNLHRAALLCYPRWWRESRAEEVIGLLQDSAEANGRRRPSTADLLNLAAHGLRVRVGTSATRPDQQVRNRISVVALALIAAVCTTLLIFGEWAPWDPRSSMEASPVANVTTGSACYLLGLLAVIAAALGRTTGGRWLATCCGVSALAIMWAPVAELAHDYGLTRPPGAILAFLAVLCALVSVGDPLPPRGSRGLFVLLATLPTIGAVLVTALSLGPEPWFYYRLPDQIALRAHSGILLGIGLTVAAIVLLIGGRRVWAAALAANAVPWLLLFYVAPLAPGFGLLVGVIALAVVAGAAVRRGSRRYQPSRSSSASSE